MQYSIIITEDNKCYAWGYDKYKLFGSDKIIEIDNLIELKPPSSLNLNNEYYIQIVCNKNNIFGLTKNKKCYVWGINDHFQLGLGKSFPLQNFIGTPTELKVPLSKNNILDNFISISHTRFCVLGLTENKKCYGWGSNIMSQLGMEKLIDINIPTEIICKDLQKGEYFIQASCGNYHSVLLTNKNRIFGSGSNSCEQLNFLGSSYSYLKFEEMKNPEKVSFSKIICGPYYTLRLTKEGICYFTGLEPTIYGYKGTERQYKIENDKIIDIITVDDNYIIFSTEKEKIYMYGDEYKEIFSSYDYIKEELNEIKLPSKDPNEKIISFSTGLANCILLTNKRRLYYNGIIYKGLNIESRNEGKLSEIKLPFETKVKNLWNESYGVYQRLEWEIQKLLWLGNIKNSESILYKLSRDILKYIIKIYN